MKHRLHHHTCDSLTNIQDKKKILAIDEWAGGREEGYIITVKKISTKTFRRERRKYQNGESLGIFKPRVDIILKVWGNVIHTLVDSVTE